MYQPAQMIVLAALSALSSALPPSSQSGGGLQGYGTFNVYSSQNTKNCDGLFGEQTAGGGARFTPMFRNNSTNASFTGQGTEELAKNAQNNIYQAAISDVSKGLGEYRCNYSEKDMQHDPNQCTDRVDGTTYKLPNYSYIAPGCPDAPCGRCYTITNNANQKKITVQVVDACPKDTAWNYCKALATSPTDNIPANQRCADPDTNQVDIDVSAYPALTGGQSYQSVSGIFPCDESGVGRLMNFLFCRAGFHAELGYHHHTQPRVHRFLKRDGYF
ncbi:MAG: hypothetical protein LQ348_001512 [Seirophora lacunosa]|nr:MAG: hypothetical protein LQ348_001512 [Seirophora lacunosa]